MPHENLVKEDGTHCIDLDLALFWPWVGMLRVFHFKYRILT